MVDIFGGSSSLLKGGCGPPGPAGPAGERGQSGESSGYFAQFFQHSKIKWDIDYEPNFWIEGYDIEETKTTFKVLNKYGHHFDGVCTAKPVKGGDSISLRRLLSLNGTQFITCPMDWNGGELLDNLQVFIVFKYNDVSGSGLRNGLFGNDNGYFDRFV